MSKRRMNKALTRLAVDPDFLADFRQDPEATLGRYKLSETQVAAIKAGDASSLAACGVDVVALAEGRPLGRIARRLPRAAAAAFALRALVLPLAPAGAAGAGGPAPGRTVIARVRARTIRARGLARARTAMARARAGAAREGGLARARTARARARARIEGAFRDFDILKREAPLDLD